MANAGSCVMSSSFFLLYFFLFFLDAHVVFDNDKQHVFHYIEDEGNKQQERKRNDRTLPTYKKRKRKEKQRKEKTKKQKQKQKK